MRVRLSHVTHTRSGVAARHDEVVDVPTLTIGRGTDNALCLLDLTVSLHHATIETRSGGTYVRAIGSAPVLLNGRVIADAKLSPGDIVRIGPFELRVLPAAESEDLAIEVEEVARRASDRDAVRARTRIDFPRRAVLIWTAASLTGVGVLGVFFVVPLAGRLRSSWNVGEIAHPHSYFAADCSRCHATEFRSVRDEDCMTPRCHATQHAHVPEDVRSADVRDPPCVSCHQEHRGADALTAVAQGRCTACHATLQARLPPGRETEDVADFGAAHPEFRVTLGSAARLDAGVGPPMRGQRVRWRPDLEERSGLKFSHLRHVGQGMCVPGTSDSDLRCEQCHQLDAGGRTFLPISFERHCQHCHSLAFDEGRDRQARHGEAAAMRDDLRGYYAQLALGGDAVTPSLLQRRIPGRELTPEERRVSAAWVESQVDAANCFLMGVGGQCVPRERKLPCAECHELLPTGAKDGGPTVAPVDLTTRWFPYATFSHTSHAPFPCNECHPRAAVYDAAFVPEDSRCRPPRPAWSTKGIFALRDRSELPPGEAPSTKAADVLVPSLERCRSCHTGANGAPPLQATAHVGTSWVASECGLCHSYHRPEANPFGGPRLASLATAR